MREVQRREYGRHFSRLPAGYQAGTYITVLLADGLRTINSQHSIWWPLNVEGANYCSRFRARLLSFLSLRISIIISREMIYLQVL